MSTRRLAPEKHVSTTQVTYACQIVARPTAPASYDDEHLLRLRKAVGQLGWSLAVHGTLLRDIDVIAVPWVEDCEPQLAVFNAFLYHGYVLFGAIESRPHGRLAVTFSGPADRVIDLSVFPTRGAV